VWFSLPLPSRRLPLKKSRLLNNRRLKSLPPRKNRQPPQMLTGLPSFYQAGLTTFPGTRPPLKA
jgi:hypothetical protein